MSVPETTSAVSEPFLAWTMSGEVGFQERENKQQASPRQSPSILLEITAWRLLFDLKLRPHQLVSEPILHSHQLFRFCVFAGNLKQG